MTTKAVAVYKSIMATIGVYTERDMSTGRKMEVINDDKGGCCGCSIYENVDEINGQCSDYENSTDHANTFEWLQILFSTAEGDQRGNFSKVLIPLQMISLCLDLRPLKF